MVQELTTVETTVCGDFHQLGSHWRVSTEINLEIGIPREGIAMSIVLNKAIKKGV